MHANDTNARNQPEKLIHPQLSYLLTGICFEAHNNLGRFARERQYGDFLENKFQMLRIPYIREKYVKNTRNIFDFLVDDKIILELKTRDSIIREDYHQIQRYLQDAKVKLGLLVNFRNRYLKPIRVIRIDTDVPSKFV